MLDVFAAWTFGLLRKENIGFGKHTGNVIGMRAAHPKTHPKSCKTLFVISTATWHFILLFTIKISVLFLKGAKIYCWENDMMHNPRNVEETSKEV
jgi:hypothetical protein